MPKLIALHEILLQFISFPPLVVHASYTCLLGMLQRSALVSLLEIAGLIECTKQFRLDKGAVNGNAVK